LLGAVLQEAEFQTHSITGFKSLMSRLSALTFICCALACTAAEAQQTDPLLNLPLEKKLDLAKAGDVEAMMAVAEAYERGLGTKPDIVQAAKLYRDLALKQNLEAQYRLARMIRTGGDGLKRDMPSAVTLMSDAANRNHSGAQYELGLMFEQGIGVEKDDAKAAQLYEKAAAQNHPQGMRNLAVMLLYGRGAKQDVKRSAELLQKSADAEDGWAINNLAVLYEQGWGVARDPAKARSLYAKASALGIPVAELNIKRLEATSQARP
jgi:uncharacterized protein